MRKEKQVKSYQRKTKSGKLVTVKAHTAKYDAAEKAKSASHKKGAGTELAVRKNKMPDYNLKMEEYLEELKKHSKGDSDRVKKDTTDSVSKKEASKKEVKKKRPVGGGTTGLEPKTKKREVKSPAKKKGLSGISASDFKEWYNGTGSAADKKVAKALRAQLGSAGYRKLENEAIDNYSSRGHLSMFKRVGGESSATTSKKSASSESKSSGIAKSSNSAKDLKVMGNDYSKITNKSLQRKITRYVQEATNWEHSKDARDYTWKDTLRALSDPGEKSVRFGVDKMISGGETSRKTTATTSVKSKKNPKEYRVSYKGSDGKVHTESFSTKEAADDFKMSTNSLPRGEFITLKTKRR